MADSLSKYLAQAGYCSRRQAVEFIKEGKVKVNGIKVTEPGRKIGEKDIVKVGTKVIRSEQRIYILLNKPKGYITSVSDELGRKTVMDLLIDAPKVRLYPVGRLDAQTTGLLILTNDGELAQKLSHPRFEIQKTYEVTLNRAITPADLETIAKGFRFDDGPVEVDSVEISHPKTPYIVNITLHSGKNRIVRRIFEYMQYRVDELDRIKYAGLTKKGLPRGRWRFLKESDLSHLKK